MRLFFLPTHHDPRRCGALLRRRRRRSSSSQIPVGRHIALPRLPYCRHAPRAPFLRRWRPPVESRCLGDPAPPPPLRRRRWHGLLRCIHTSGGMDPLTFSAQSDGVTMFLEEFCEDERTAGNTELEINHRNKDGRIVRLAGNLSRVCWISDLNVIFIDEFKSSWTQSGKTFGSGV